MSTSEYRAVDAESELPISAADLAALATQLFAASVRPGADSPPQTVPVAPRGSVPDTTTFSSAAQTAAGLSHVFPGSVPLLGVQDATRWAATSFGPEGGPTAVPVPGTAAVPVPGTAAVPWGSGAPWGASAATGGTPDLPTGVGDLSAFAVPQGIVPTVPGVLAGATAPAVPGVPVAPRGVPVVPPTIPASPRGVPPVVPPAVPPVVPPSGGSSAWASPSWVPVGPSAPPAVTVGDEGNYHFLTGALPAPQLPARYDVFDVDAVRADFPILHETVNRNPLIWFDNAATTQKPQVVIDRLAHFYAHENSNIHRAAHELAARATDAYEEGRETVRRFIGASRDEEIIFVRGTTEAINLVAYAWGGKHLGPGDEILITHLEHHANIVPWQLLSQRTGAVLKVAPVDDAGNLLMSDFEDLLGPRTKLVAATEVSNALGTVTPVQQIVDLGHRYGARVLIDGAQSIPHRPIDVSALGADFFVFSGHKIYGPTGIGVLYGTEDALAETAPWQGGGNMIADVTLERSLYQGSPSKFEAGTGNIADAVGLAEALRYVERLGIERIAAHEHALLEYATPRLAEIPGVRLVGTAAEKASVLSFVLDGHDPVEVGKALNSEGIAVRAGHHCAQPILRRYGLEATVRPSFAFYNTFGEIDVFLGAVRRIAERGVNLGWNPGQGGYPSRTDQLRSR